ncbi:metallophosphoesterase [candidate division KSB1 bacterium]|nr:metallophosphoesterase [candidate division KSB1 bacterium]
MKIAHLSDLHICQKSRPKNLEKVRMLFEYALNKKADHFVITGDIVHLGEAEDFNAFRQALNEFDLLDSNRTTLVIGNHDIFGGVYLAEDILTFPQKCMAVDYQKKLLEFKNFFFETYENTLFQSADDTYPFAKIIGDIAFIGINSTRPYSRFKNPFASKGMVDDAQIKKMNRLLSRRELTGKIKIALIHHHFQKLGKKKPAFGSSFLINLESIGGKLKKKKRLLNVFRRHKINLVLHGHEHQSGHYQSKNLRFMNGGGSIDNNEPDRFKLNFIKVNPSKIQCKVKTIAYKDAFEERAVHVREPVMIS